MNHLEIKKPALEASGVIEEILDVWEDSVRATHHFLSESEIVEIRPQVCERLRDVQLFGAYDGSRLVAFAGTAGKKLDMLFVHSACRGKGAGRLLLEHAIQNHGVRMLEVNRDNPQAIGFYERMGFTVCYSSETDSQGNPYPILFMELRTS